MYGVVPASTKLWITVSSLQNYASMGLLKGSRVTNEERKTTS